LNLEISRGAPQVAAGVAVLFVLALTGPPSAAQAAAGVAVPTATADSDVTCTTDVAKAMCHGLDVTESTVGVNAAVTPPADPIPPSGTATPDITVTSDGPSDDAATRAPNTGGRYLLSGVIIGPADHTVLPGGTATMAVALRNDGPAAATDAPVTLEAPYGTVFGALSGDIGQACVTSSRTRLSCRVSLNPDATTVWNLPVTVAGDADPATALTGGCLDLDGDGACDPARGTDVALPDVRLRVPRVPAPTPSADHPAIKPATRAATTVAPTVARRATTARIFTADPPTVVAASGSPACPAVSDCDSVSVAAATTAPPTPSPSPPNDNSNFGGYGGDNLPRTGQNVLALLALSAVLIVGGLVMRFAARSRPRRAPCGTV
jgi:hypothetical protein